MSLLLLIVAIVLFLVASLGVGAVGPFATVALGLAFLAASFLPLGSISVRKD